jgi:hypothetical protein
MTIAGFKRLSGKPRTGTLAGAAASICLLTMLCVVGTAWAGSAEDRCYKGVCVRIPAPEKAVRPKKRICVTPHHVCSDNSVNGFLGDNCFCATDPAVGTAAGYEDGRVEEAD